MPRDAGKCYIEFKEKPARAPGIYLVPACLGLTAARYSYGSGENARAFVASRAVPPREPLGTGSTSRGALLAGAMASRGFNN